MNKKIHCFISFSQQQGKKNETCLQLNVIDPTEIRALADLLPEFEIIKDDPFNSHPTDYELMNPEVLTKIQNGEALEIGKIDDLLP